MKTLLLIFICLLYGCGVQTIENEAPGTNEIKKGKKFRIILPEDHTTGYTWQMSDGYDRKKADRLNEVWHGNEKGIYFNFVAIDTGQATLDFILRKHTDTMSYKRFVVKITDN